MQGEVLGDEQDSKDVGETLAEGVMRKGKVFSRGRTCSGAMTLCMPEN